MVVILSRAWGLGCARRAGGGGAWRWWTVQTMRLFGVMVRPARPGPGWALVLAEELEPGETLAGAWAGIRCKRRPEVGTVLDVRRFLGDGILAALLLTGPGRQVIRGAGAGDLSAIAEAAACVPTSPPWPGGAW